MDTSSAAVETKVTDLLDVSLSALADDHDAQIVLSRIVGEPALRDAPARRTFNSALRGNE
ncbi:MAG TPA: hypothetical protein VF069_19890 [Streptosporangiaceae bacterium]